MKRLVTDSISGSFDFWINACSSEIASFEPKETFEDMKRKNFELEIHEDNRQANSELHETLLNSIVD
jgi:hypothetical protein